MAGTTASGESSVTISWNTDEAAFSRVGYGLTSEYGETTAMTDVALLRHSHIITGLAPNTTYHYRVSVRDAAGNYSYSVDATFQTPQLPPGQTPTNPPQTGETPDTDSGGGNAGQTGQSGSQENAQLSSGSQGGGSIDIIPPGKPERVRASGLDSVVMLTWQNPTDADFSRVRVVRNFNRYPVNQTDGIVVYDGDSRIFSDRGLQNGETYYYSLFAADHKGNYAAPVQLSISPEAGVNQYHVATAENDTIKMLTTDTYGQGRQGPEVVYLQQLLATNPELYPEGRVTGYFGPLTEAALKRFQRKYEIPQTGVVDADVRAIARTLSVPHVETSPASALDLELGDSGESVRVLQTALVRFGYLMADAITGYFGELTRAAVISFQRDRNIEPAAGYVGPKTRAAGILELRGN
jgi:peptidoglycan hydrolase-like protein with peptidoglycan-binding domain/chitodextrinase